VEYIQTLGEHKRRDAGQGALSNRPSSGL
jgi:hypothetical protein